MQRVDRFVLALLACSLALNVYLGAQLRESSRQVAQSVAVGKTVGEFVAYDLLGARVSLNYDGRLTQKTVFYFFSPECTWCQRNANAFDVLATSVQRDYRVVAVATSERGLGEYLERHPSQVAVVQKVERAVATAYGIGPVPQLMVVSADGKVEADWLGAFTGETKKKVEGYFGVSLPEIASEASMEEGRGTPAGGEAQTKQEVDALVEEQEKTGRVFCRDESGGVYSNGAVRHQDGVRLRCSGGRWITVPG